jgi:hypothetical protein
MKYVYANCLLFALWYWVRHPFSCRITTVCSRRGRVPHFIVLTARELIHMRSVDSTYILGPFWWRGKIERLPREEYNRMRPWKLLVS